MAGFWIYFEDRAGFVKGLNVGCEIREIKDDNK